VTDRHPSSALREIRQHLGKPVVLAALAGTAVILALSGPFRTLDLLAPLPRAAYWAVVVFGTYAIGTSVVAVLYHWTGFARLAALARIAVGGLALGFVIALALIALDAGLQMGPPQTVADMVEQIGIATVISVVVLTLREVILAQTETAKPPQPPVILDRLPPERRGPLLALSAEDHYVRVITAKGEGLVLIRLADAMREVGDVQGLQIHRSHWVAHDAVMTVRRTGETAIVTLINGHEVPVSRRFVPALRQAGLFARPAGGTVLARMDRN
jgi:DNA-binding LytR/AlgR family response regulator